MKYEKLSPRQAGKFSCSFDIFLPLVSLQLVLKIFLQGTLPVACHVLEVSIQRQGSEWPRGDGSKQTWHCRMGGWLLKLRLARRWCSVMLDSWMRDLQRLVLPCWNAGFTTRSVLGICRGILSSCRSEHISPYIGIGWDCSTAACKYLIMLQGSSNVV